MIVFRKVRWKNFLSTGNTFNEIVLDKNESTLIVGTNGSGKSSVLDSLTFGLFGKSYRKANKPQLINSINQSDCLVEIEFAVGNTEYKIRRGMKPNIFEIYQNGALLNQDSATRDYQKYLETNILKINFKSFTQVAVLGSTSFVPFMQLTAADRRAVIEDLLDIRIFSSMNSVLKSKVSEATDAKNRVEQELRIINNSLKIQKENQTNQISLVEKQIRDNKDQIETMKKKISDLETARDTHIETIEKLCKTVEELEKWEDAEKKLSENIKTVDTTIRRQQEQLAFLQDNDVCYTCKQTIDPEFRDSRVESISGEISRVQEGSLKTLQERSETVLSHLKNFRGARDALAKERADLSSCTNEIRALETGIENLKEASRKILKDYQNTRLNNHEQLLKDKEKYLLQQAGLEDDFRYYEAIAQMLKDKGVKAKIISHYLPVMNKLINQYLSALDFYVNFTLDENFNETIRSRHRDEFSYNSFSEGEKLRIDIAILFAWREISKMKNSTNTNILILDEIFDSSLDVAGIDDFFKIMKQLSGEISIFVISHRANMWSDKFANTIRFSKHREFSVCKQGVD